MATKDDVCLLLNTDTVVCAGHVFLSPIGHSWSQ